MRPTLLALAFIACKGSPTPPVESDTDTDADTDTDTDADADSDSDADADTDADTDTDEATQIGFAIYPSQPVVPVGEAVQLRSRTVWSDGSVVNQTNSTTWSANEPTLGIMGTDGLFTAAAPGIVRVTAAYGADTVNGHLQVVDPSDTVASLTLHPTDASVGVGSDVLFMARATMTSGVEGDLGARCTWSSSDPLVGAMGAAGAVTTLSAGVTTIQASCPDVAPVSTTLTVGPPPPRPDLEITEVITRSVAPDVFRYEVIVTNTGGYSGPFMLDFYADEAVEPTTTGQARLPVIGLGTGSSLEVWMDHVWTGPRPATLQSWAVIDVEGRLNDVDRANNAAFTTTTLESDVLADISVDLSEIVVFGPTDAGVVAYITNNGPADLTDVTVYFERDAPTATVLSDVDAPSAERSEIIASLPSGDTYTWLFDYDQVPFGMTWTSCAFVFADDFSDPDLANNLSCTVFPEY